MISESPSELLTTAAAALLMGAALVGCASDTERALTSRAALFAPVLARAEEHRLQVLITEVEPATPDGCATVRTSRSGYRVDAEYFYPASTIKLGAAIAACEMLADLRRAGELVGLDTPLRVHPLAGEAAEGAPQERDDTNQSGGVITTGHEIRKLFIVSDNRAFNRLYDLVGPEGLNRSAWNAGLHSVWISHRLSVARTPEQNLRAARVDLLAPGSDVVIPERVAPPGWQPITGAPPGLVVGTGFMRGDGTIAPAKSFAENNRISLVDLQNMLIALARPELAPRFGATPFRLDEADRVFLLEAMREYPADSANPAYSRDDHPDEWGKFLLPGLLRVAPREHWRIANKVGQAYGFTLDNAFVEHIPSGRAAFVSATIYCNDDGVLNDNRYEYASIALPFMANLGEVIGRRLVRSHGR